MSDDLLERSAGEDPAELGIIVATQVSELWWTLIARELTACQEQLRVDNPNEATKTLRRVVVHFEPLNATWPSIASMAPKDLEAIGEDTIFQGLHYHHVLCLLGGAQFEQLPFLSSRRNRAQLKSTLVKPSVYDDVLAYFDRIGLSVPEEVLTRSPGVPYASSLAVEQVWRDIYEDPYPDATLQQLGEALVDIASALSDWKCRHLMTMHRTFGGGPASFPGEPADAPVHAIGALPFPELWSARRTLNSASPPRSFLRRSLP